MAPCAHNETTAPDDEGVVICSRCLETFKPKTPINDILGRLEQRKRDRGV